MIYEKSLFTADLRSDRKTMLKLVIEKKRMQMIYLANITGLTSKKTVKCSQELDELLNLVQNVNHAQ